MITALQAAKIDTANDLREIHDRIKCILQRPPGCLTIESRSNLLRVQTAVDDILEPIVTNTILNKL